MLTKATSAKMLIHDNEANIILSSTVYMGVVVFFLLRIDSCFFYRRWRLTFAKNFIGSRLLFFPSFVSQ